MKPGDKVRFTARCRKQWCCQWQQTANSVYRRALTNWNRVFIVRSVSVGHVVLIDDPESLYATNDQLELIP